MPIREAGWLSTIAIRGFAADFEMGDSFFTTDGWFQLDSVLRH